MFYVEIVSTQLEMPLPQILVPPTWELPILSNPLTTWEFLPTKLPDGRYLGGTPKKAVHCSQVGAPK